MDISSAQGMNSGNPYGKRRNGGLHGDVYTDRSVVQYMLDLVGYTCDKDLSNVSIIEPSCGEGEFIIEIALRLKRSSLLFGFNAEEAFIKNVYGYDIDAGKIYICRKRLYDIGFISTEENITACDFLTTKVPNADIVIGNPPYVRYENIPEEKRILYRKLFPTFHYRADLYVLFYEKSLRLLNSGGKHCFICANRWLKNEYGKKLRLLVARNYRMERIINLERANSFQEDVLAYPAVTLIINKKPQPSTLYGEASKVDNLPTLIPEPRKMPQEEDWTPIFNKHDGDRATCTIEEMGFKIGIGVATGADNIFISQKLPEMVEPNILLPAINAKDLKGDSFHWDGKYLLNPYTPDGKLIDLADYPMAQSYLQSFRERLEKRHIATKNRTHWYRTIDRINPSLLSKAKILLPDLSGNKYVFIDEGNYYPLHNIYYITGKSLRDLKILSAILMSTFIRNQIGSITNNMNGGFPRWQSQYLRKLKIPDYRQTSDEIINSIVECYEQRDLEGINYLTEQISKHRPIDNPVPLKRTTQQLAFDFA